MRCMCMWAMHSSAGLDFSFFFFSLLLRCARDDVARARRFNDLALAAVARSFCLLRLPKIAELSDPAVTESFEKEKTIDFTAIKCVHARSQRHPC